MLNWIVKGLLQWFYGLLWQMGEYIMNALMDVFNMDMTYFNTAVPISETIMNIMFGVGWALLIGNLVFQAAKAMMSGIGFEGEDPRTLGFRTMVFAFLLVCSRQICGIGLSLGATVVDLLQVPSSVVLPSLADDMFGIDASWFLMIIVGIIILFQLVKFFFEVGERYVIVGVLTILSPLAFAMGGSRNTMEIFKGWARMYGSMCLMLVMNVVFMKLIISAMSIFPHGLMVFPWLILIIALARVARKIDSIIARIGLNPAITGDGLGRGLPGMMALMVGKSLLSGMASGKMGAGKAAAGAAKAAAGAAGTAGAASGFKGGTRPGPSPVNTGAGSGNTPPGTAAGADPINNAQNAGTAGASFNPPIRNAGQGGAGSASPINVSPNVGANPAGGTPSNPPIGHAGVSPQGKGSRQPAAYPGSHRSHAGMRGKGGIAVSADDMPERKTGRDSGITQSPPMNVAGNAIPIDTGKAAGANHPDSSEKANRSPVGANPANMQTPTGGASGGQAPIRTDAPGNAGQNGGNRGDGGVTPIHANSQSQSVQQGARTGSNTAVQQGGSTGQSDTNKY